MSRRRTGWEMIVDLASKALAELEQSDFRHEDHVTRARKILTDALFLASMHEVPK